MKKIKNIGLLLFLILSTLSFSYQVNYDDVVDIVLRNYPQSRVTKIEIANYKGKTVYEGETFNKGQKIEFIINVNTGELIFSLFRKINKEHNQSIVVVTHARDLSQVTDRQIYLKRGVLE